MQTIRDICIDYSALRFRFLEHTDQIKKAFEEKDLQKLVLLIMKVFIIKDGILQRIGTSGKIGDASAMVHTRHYGDFLVSADLIFKSSREEIFSQPMGHILHTIAHEVSHLKMFSDRYKHANSEFATDILAAVVTAYNGEHLYDVTNYDTSFGGVQYGYIRDDIFSLVSETLARHRDVLYLKK